MLRTAAAPRIPQGRTMPDTAISPSPNRVTARAILLGERLDTLGLERSDMLATTPLAFRIGEHGFVALFRYGVAVLAGLTPIEEDEILRGLRARVITPTEQREDETATIDISHDRDGQVPPGGPIYVVALTPERFLVIADVLAKSVSLARDEREVRNVFDIIEPVTSRLTTTGRTPGKRRELMRIIGRALMVQQRMAGRVAVDEKPDILWDAPIHERLFLRLEDEYELKERAGALTRKLEVIDESARAFTDLIDTERSLRLEWAIVLLIVFEVFFTLWQTFVLRLPH